MTEDILSTVVGQKTLREMSGIEFYSWVLKKINGLQSKSPALNELALLASSFFGKNLPDEAKLDAIKKLQILGVEI